MFALNPLRLVLKLCMNHAQTRHKLISLETECMCVLFTSMQTFEYVDYNSGAFILSTKEAHKTQRSIHFMYAVLHCAE